jgi:pilus assembly protein CpaB
MYTARIVVLTIALSAGGAAGKTVSLELKPEQAETLAPARQDGTPALAHGGNVNVVRYGVSSLTTTQK